MYIKLAGVPTSVNAAVNAVDDELRRIYKEGMDEDAFQAVLRNDEEEIEGWVEDLMARLGVRVVVAEKFRQEMAKWRNINA